MKGKKVLLGDVVDTNNDLIKRYLVKLWINEENIVAVNNWLEAVKLATSQLFDVIILGVRMVWMDGIQASQEIKSYYRWSAPKIIGTTSQQIEKVESFDDVIENPYTKETFNEKILNVLNMS
jgi:CheY-like chemotaxis protein